MKPLSSLDHPEPPADRRLQNRDYVPDSKWYTKEYAKTLGNEFTEERHPDPQWRRWVRERPDRTITVSVAIPHNTAPGKWIKEGTLPAHWMVEVHGGPVTAILTGSGSTNLKAHLQPFLNPATERQ